MTSASSLSTYFPEVGPDPVRRDAYRTLLVATGLLFLTLTPHSGALGLASAPLFLLCLHRFLRLASSLTAPTSPDQLPDDTDPSDDSRRLMRGLGLVLVACQLVRGAGDALLPTTSPYAHRLWALGLGLVVLRATRPAGRSASRGPSRSFLGPGLWLGLSLAATAVCFAYLLHHAPSPRIDVFGLQQRGAELLLSGQNPYSALYPNPYDPVETTQFFGHWIPALDHYPYPPLSLALSTLSFRLLGDVRWLFLLAHLLVAGVLYRLGQRRHNADETWDRGLALACLHLLHPRGFLVIEQSWTEPLLAAAIALWAGQRVGRAPSAPTTPAAARPRRWVADALLFGVALACKQYALLLLLPLCIPSLHAHFTPGWSRSQRLRWLVVCLLPLVVSYLPFALAAPADFVEDVVLFQLRQPFRAEALSLPALFYALSDIKLPGATAALGLALPVWYFARRKPGSLPSGTGGFLLLASLLFLGFFATAKQAFCNYYYLLGVLLLLTLAQLREAPPEPPAPAPAAQGS